jgi:methionyl-tRNA synthetase
VDTVRYYLVRETVFGGDGQFSPEQFVERVNTDLANDFGNLLNRTINMVKKYFSGVVPNHQAPISSFDASLASLTKQTIDDYQTLMNQLLITEAYAKVNQLVARANKYIDETQPWNLAKDPEKSKQLQVVMHQLIYTLFVSGALYSPILVTTSDTFFAQLGVKQQPKLKDLENPKIVNGLVLNQPIPLFPRLDPLIEVPFIQSTIIKK